ncbi:hypothetical protein D3C71_1748190 [compost metagenome]
MTASQPVRASTKAAFCGESMSPLAITGIDNCALIAAMVSYSATPAYCWSRVRPCTASAAMPDCSAMRAISGALRWSWSQPVRILSVTGTSTAATTASRIFATSSGSRIRAEPAQALQTFLAGQPMLMSTICAP